VSRAALGRAGLLAQRAGVGFALAGGLWLGACQDEPPPAAEAPVEASTEKKPAVDDKIASAMAAAAEASARSGSQRSEGQPAPPADGILAAEAATRELAPGSPATLVLGADGVEPRVRLGAPAPGVSLHAKLSLSYRSGGSVMPTIELDLASKGAGGSPERASAALTAGGASGAPVGAVAALFTVGGARPAGNQPGRLPENARAEIAKLNGSSIERVSSPNGALIAHTQKLAGNNPDLEPLLTGSAEVLASVLLPYPEAPVGAGAFWMVKSRELANGAPVLAYRMVKLVELGSAQAKLSVSTRRYLLDPVLPMAGLPPHHVRRFESTGEATLNLRPGAPYPESADVRDTFMALVAPDDRPNQALPIQSELSASITFSR
jgi:hypothetical protein